MGKLKVLFIGGSGIISSACARVAVGGGDIDLYVLNRGRSTTRPLPGGVTELRGDIREPGTVRDALGNRDFDCVVDWVAFTPDHVRTDLDLFRDRTGQYVFISSASAYQTPAARLPVTESTLLRNPHWQYSRDKIACEDLLVAQYRESGFPVTIVRPSHTYDKTSAVLDRGWTALPRMLAGQARVGDGGGNTPLAPTHQEGFPRAFGPVSRAPRAVGEAFHITSDDFLTWDQIARALASALGVTPRIVHVPSDVIAAADPAWGAGLLGDKTHSLIFDNSKIKAIAPGWHAVIPFERGAREIADWHLADPSRQVADAGRDALMDKLAEAYRVRLSRGDAEDGVARRDAPQLLAGRVGVDAVEEDPALELPAPQVLAQDLRLGVVIDLCRGEALGLAAEAEFSLAARGAQVADPLGGAARRDQVALSACRQRVDDGAARLPRRASLDGQQPGAIEADADPGEPGDGVVQETGALRGGGVARFRAHDVLLALSGMPALCESGALG